MKPGLPNRDWITTRINLHVQRRQRNANGDNGGVGHFAENSRTENRGVAFLFRSSALYSHLFAKKPYYTIVSSSSEFESSDAVKQNA